MKLIGITGTIGVGKSTLLQCISDLGGRTIDADAVVHSLYAADREMIRRMVERWGSGIVGEQGDLDRQAVARIVFRQPEQLKWLNELIHPAVRARLIEVAGQSPEKPLFCAVPLLYEAGWQDDFASVICVWCDSRRQLSRLRRRGWSKGEIDRRLGSQWSAESKADLADLVVVNVGSRRILSEQCREFMARPEFSLQLTSKRHDGEV